MDEFIIPNSLADLKGLNYLDISDCKILDIPASIGELTNLEHLYIKNCETESIDPAIGNLTNLITLNLANNRNLKSVPETIGNLVNLETLSFDSCKNITRISDVDHDDIIAFTSQLTHAIAISLVNSDDNKHDTSLFIGDSYKDLTRIAMINEELWSELFIQNKDFLTKRITSFENKLTELKNAIATKDKDKIKEIMKESARIRGNIK